MIQKQLLAVIGLFLIISCSSSDNSMELITDLEGDLEIRSLKDLEDPIIKGYKTIHGNLIINYTNEVEDLSALENLEIINGGILIRYNDNLKSLRGLEKITKLNFLEIEHNLELNSLNGLENLTNISNSLRIAENRKLETLNSLNSLTDIGVQFFLSNNNLLTNLKGLENLKQIPQIIILDNLNLMSLNGLEGITSSANIGVLSNDSLTNFCSLVPFVQANSQTIKFSAGFNSYNPSLEDLINNNCSN
ncbi:hypothetical protein JL193_07590 [Polaribacter batillariae]|uniref:Receptor L-domain domain-containing protein n=1 Tax=Polaribacter batillariae TaxID=2808900 RepID=A0ABX7T015_9FLAO|nr:hypothetical protein [Polaribacter batillariae]QTD39098.1 hypothetical protein JL193_07590 [Polaribacter batillariae]